MPGLFHTIKPQNAKWPRKLHPMRSTSTWTFSMLGSGISVENSFSWTLKGKCCRFSPWESPILFVMFEMHWVSDYFRDPLNARFIGTQLHWSTAGLLCFVMLSGPCCYCARHRTTGLPDTSHCRMSLAPWAQRSNVRSRGSDMIRVAAFLCSFKSAVTKTKCQWRFSYGNEHFTQILLDISSA